MLGQVCAKPASHYCQLATCFPLPRARNARRASRKPQPGREPSTRDQTGNLHRWRALCLATRPPLAPATVEPATNTGGAPPGGARAGSHTAAGDGRTQGPRQETLRLSKEEKARKLLDTRQAETRRRPAGTRCLPSRPRRGRRTCRRCRRCRATRGRSGGRCRTHLTRGRSGGRCLTRGRPTTR